MEICTTSRQHLPPGEQFWDTGSVCQRTFKDLNYKKLQWANVKRNLLMQENNNSNNNKNKKCSVIGPRTVSFFKWA